MYEFEGRIRFSEVGADGHLPIDGVVNYFQDCSTFQSEDLGLGVEHLRGKNRAWLLSSWQVVVNRYPEMGEKVKTGTWAWRFQGLYGSRNFLMRDQAGHDIAYANSIWVYVDTTTGHPARPKPEEIAAYAPEEPYPMEYAPRKIALPKDFAESDSFLVNRGNLDTNQHVNNGQYICMAKEYLPKGFAVKQMRADYKKAAVLGSRIFPLVSLAENKAVICLADDERKPYVTVEFYQ